MERPNQCNADECACADGRESDKPSNELIICETCGSNCIHQKCWQRNEPYYCCFPIDWKTAATDSEQQSTNHGNTASNNSEVIVELRRKRKMEHQTDDEKMDEKRRRKRLKRNGESPTRPSAKDAVNCSSKVICKKKESKISSNFPITKIRNGTFDQVLRFTPRVLIYPLDPLSLETFSISSKKTEEPSNSNRSLITSNLDTKFSKKEFNSSAFAVISPTKKAGGKSFKNYTITSFFKPFQ